MLGAARRCHSEVVKHVLGKLTQRFVVIKTPGSGDGSCVKDFPPLRAFPIDDFCKSLVFTEPPLVGLSIEIEDVSLVMAAC